MDKRLVVFTIIFFFSMGLYSVNAAPFHDIHEGEHGFNELTYLKEQDIIKGSKDGYFNPGDNLIRSEAAAMLGRSLDLEGEPTETSFKDVRDYSFASGYIQSAYEKKIINGTGGGKFSPDSKLTRGQMAIMLANAFELPATDFDYFVDKPLGSATFDAINRIAAAGISNGVDGKNFKPHAYITRKDFAVFLARAMNSDFQVVTTANLSIVIDAGHGDHDPGAVANGLLEKDITLDTALRTEKQLQQLGYHVVMTRRTDTFLELTERAELANRVNADVFVSIHANAGGGTGTETYYYGTASTYSKEGKKLAEAIQDRLVKLGMRDRGEKYAKFTVLAKTKMPASLVELGFIDTKSDAEKLGDPAWREKAAKAISLGISDYFAGK